MEFKERRAWKRYEYNESGHNEENNAGGKNVALTTCKHAVQKLTRCFGQLSPMLHHVLHGLYTKRT